MTLPRGVVRVLLACLLLTVLGVASACGGSDDSAGPDDTSSSSPDDGADAPGGAVAPTSEPTTDISEQPKNTPSDDATSDDPETDSPPRTETPSLPPVDIDGAPTTYAAGLAKIQAATGDRVKASRFFTPSGNLYCVLRSQYLTPGCELGEGGVDDPDYCGTNGATTFVGRIELPDGVPTPVCNTDTIREPGGGTVAYGEVVFEPRSSVECLVEEIGVTCLDSSTDQGFFLARGTYALLT